MYIRKKDGYLSSGSKRKGKLVFTSPQAFQRNKINMVLNNIRKSCKEKDLPLDVDQDYLLSIFPKDFICPVSKIEMKWGKETGRDCSPSIDRIFPEKGYIKGNLVWVSCLVNRIKSNATIDLLNKISDYYSQFE